MKRNPFYDVSEDGKTLTIKVSGKYELSIPQGFVLYVSEDLEDDFIIEDRDKY